MTHSAMPCVLVYHFFILTHFVVIYDLLLTHTWVIVKKSSPKNLSADCQSTVSRQLVVCRPTGFARNIGYLSATFFLNLSVTCWLAVGRLSVTCRPTVDRQSADRFFGELFFTITHTWQHGIYLSNIHHYKFYVNFY